MASLRAWISILTLLIYLVLVGQGPTSMLCLEADGRVQVEGVACLQDDCATLAAMPATSPPTVGTSTIDKASDCGPSCTDLPLLVDGTQPTSSGLDAVSGSADYLHPALPRPPTVRDVPFPHQLRPFDAFASDLSQRQTVVLLC